MNRYVVLSVMVLLSFFAVSSALAQKMKLQGKITDRETGEALMGANIELKSLDSGMRPFGASSNDRGEYVVHGITSGRYSVTITYIGYARKVFDEIEFITSDEKTLDAALDPSAINIEQIVVTASRRQEKALGSPASVTIVEEGDMKSRSVMTLADHLLALPGVDVTRNGLNQSNVVLRGFNNVFSGDLQTIVDNRIARVPSLRGNVYQFISTSNNDIERMEIVLGPGSALYGPNTASGVLHIITKPPFKSVGTDISITGGERSVAMTSIRHAGVINDKFGYKFSFNFQRGHDWEFTDPIEVISRQNAIAGGANPSTLRTGKRDFDLEKFGSDIRFDVRASPDLTIIANGGFNRASNIWLVPIGAVQAVDWKYSYAQGRILYKDFFIQAFLNKSGAGDTYLLRNGSDIVDESTLFVSQIQHLWAVSPRQIFTYGIDILRTRPDTKGTIHGRNEDNDDIDEFGAYIQSETKLTDQLKLVAAGRYDDHSNLKDPIFSPRAALVFQPSGSHTFRATFNRAFRTPSAKNLFLDLNVSQASLTQPFSVRVRGVPESGFTFSRDIGTGGIGGLFMQPLWLPASQKASFIPAEATSMWPVIVGILAAQGIDISAIPAPPASSVGTVLQILNPTTGGFDLISHTSIQDINRIESTTTNTFEFGYKGVIGKRFLVAADIYYSQIKNFIGDERVVTPNVFLDPATLRAYLSNPLFGMPAAQVATLTAAIAGIPVGTVTPDNALDPADLMLTFRNFGDIDLIGLDLSFTYYFNSSWNINGNYSFVSKDFFENVDGIADIALNAPKNKFGGALNYINRGAGFDAQIRVRDVGAFPVSTGVFIGNIENYTVVDFKGGYDLPFAPGMNLSVTVQNVFDDEHQEMIGAPKIGRLAFLSLNLSF